MSGDKERRKVKSLKLRVTTPNVKTMTGKGLELVGMMQKRNADVLCVQETKPKLSAIGAGFTLFYHGVDSKKK